MSYTFAKDILALLLLAGVSHDTHHATIRKQYKIATDSNDKLSSDELSAIREDLEAFAQEEEPEEEIDLEAALEAANSEKYLKERRKEDSNWKKVLEVTEVTNRGNPSRVLIECQDPQVNSDGISVCQKTREIAVQDLFQVYRCESCQKRAVQIYRNRLARQRRARLRELEAAAAS